MMERFGPFARKDLVNAPLVKLQVIVQRALAAKNIENGRGGCVGGAVLKVGSKIHVRAK